MTLTKVCVTIAIDFHEVIIFTDKERQLVGSGCNARVDEGKVVAYGLLAYVNMNYGRYMDAVAEEIKKRYLAEYPQYKDKFFCNFL